MAFLDKTGLQNLTNKLVQGDAIKVASSKGTTVKEVLDNIQRECESVALPNNMILENSVNKFKVGQGRNINVSRDVEEALSGIQIQGQTYQNLCESNAWFEVHSQIASSFNFEDYSNRITITKLNDNNDGWRYIRNKTLKSKMIRPNTKYTLFFKYETNCNTIPSVQLMCGSATEHLSNFYTSKKIKDNIYMCVITTFESFENKQLGAQVLYFHNATPIKAWDKTVLYKDMVLLEGDHSQALIDEIPSYFTGIKNSFEDKVVKINVQGKNLFDKNNKDIIRGQALGMHNGTYDAPDLFTSGLIKVVPNSYYSFTKARWGWLLDKNGKKVSDCSTSSKLKIPNGCEYIRITGSISDLDNIQIEQSSVTTNYEEYHNTNYRFDIKEPLRKLPNGVCDEIRNNNGKWELIRRVKEVTFNGSESWSFHSMTFGNKEGVRCILDINDFKPAIDYTNPLLFCDKLRIGCDSGSFLDRNDTVNAIFHRNDLSRAAFYIVIMMKDCNVTADDSASTKATKIKNWLKANPVTVYYELKTPIITAIDPIEFHVSQGTNIEINSDIAPVTMHEVILNRSGQIEQGIELIANLRSRIDKLEKTYDSNLIATQYRLNNLKLNYELEREED